MPYVIERLGLQGDGIADGPLYAPRVLPGEEIDGTPDGDRLVNTRILTPSTDRVSPPCRHFKSCGGCALQHASDEFVSNWKQEVVRTALAAHDVNAPLRRMHTSPASSRRRATFTARRTKSGASVGFHAPASNVIREVPDCTLVKPALLASIPNLEKLTVAGASRKGEVRLTVTETLGGLDVSVTGAKPFDQKLAIELGGFVDQADFARLSWDGEPMITKRKPQLRLGNALVTPPPGAFLQATEEGEAALLASVIDAVGDARHVADLFSGCGTFALPLAQTADVTAVESDKLMLHALDEGWRFATGLRDVKTIARDLFRRPMLPDELDKFDAIVIDPPRAGAEAQIAEICSSHVSRVASVSCNPVTFARDAAQLTKNGFKLEWIDVVDQFRWSTHVELCALFTRV